MSAQVVRGLRCQRATALGEGDLALRGGHVEVDSARRVVPERPQVRLERAAVAAGDRAGQRARIPSARALPRVCSISGP